MAVISIHTDTVELYYAAARNQFKLHQLRTGRFGDRLPLDREFNRIHYRSKLIFQHRNGKYSVMKNCFEPYFPKRMSKFQALAYALRCGYRIKEWSLPRKTKKVYEKWANRKDGILHRNRQHDRKSQLARQ